MPTEQGDIIVFLGPTLSRSDAESLLPAVYEPPVQQGAVLAVTASLPAAIVVIDGYFGWVPSVWHKEILSALAQGIPVYGASSMGALRAAELKDFGMVGYGVVFSDYVEGRLEDDDEVALIHAPAELGYRALSDALVNIRYTMAGAVRQGIVGAESADGFVRFCKQHFYPDRRFRVLLNRSVDRGILSKNDAARLEVWSRTHFRDVKREDAMGLLRQLRTAGPSPVPPEMRPLFEPTTAWAQLCDRVDARRGGKAANSARGRVPRDALLTECSVTGNWPATEAMALARVLVSRDVFRRTSVKSDEYVAELVRIGLNLELNDIDDVLVWLDEVGWSPSRFSSIVEREALVSRTREIYWNDLRDAVADILRLSGRNRWLEERALAKMEWQASASRGQYDGVNASAALDTFRALVGAAAGVSGDALARQHGWETSEDMVEDLIVEHCFVGRGD